MNKVFLIGRLVDNPEHRTTPNGVSVTTFRIGVNRRFNREQSDFFTIVAWRGLADNTTIETAFAARLRKYRQKILSFWRAQ